MPLKFLWYYPLFSYLLRIYIILSCGPNNSRALNKLILKISVILGSMTHKIYVKKFAPKISLILLLIFILITYLYYITMHAIR